MRVRFECVDGWGHPWWRLDVPQVYMVSWLGDEYEGTPAFFFDDDGVALVQEDDDVHIRIEEWVPGDGAVIVIYEGDT